MEKKEKKGSIFDSTIEAFQSFLRVPNTVTRRGSHVRDCNDLKRVMIIVVVALIPTLLFGIYNIGYVRFPQDTSPLPGILHRRSGHRVRIGPDTRP